VQRVDVISRKVKAADVATAFEVAVLIIFSTIPNPFIYENLEIGSRVL